MKNTNISSWWADFVRSFYTSYLPTKRDNINQIVLKSIFLLGTVLLVVFFCLVAVYFTNENSEQSLIAQTKESFEQLTSGQETNQKALKYFSKQNSDLKGWISIEGTSLCNPIYQTDNNYYYLTHNQLKKESKFGALFFDCNDNTEDQNTDKNLVIYGNNLENNQLFSCLDNYKSMYFYNQNPFIEFSTLNSTDTYVIFATFIINSDPKDDGDYIFDYKNNNFEQETDFAFWIEEINQRSLYSADIPVTIDDNLITLVTDSVEFDGAKLVVMARKLHDGEKPDFSLLHVNPEPRYPKVYYQKKGIKNPFDIKEEAYVSQYES